MCNMYLQDRKAGRTPRWRGVAPLHELAAAGVTVMVASDNTRDPFYAYGDLDLIEVYREATRILHFDHSAQAWLKTMAATPGEVMRLPNGRMAPGAPAGLVLTRARTDQRAAVAAADTTASCSMPASRSIARCRTIASWIRAMDR